MKETEHQFRVDFGCPFWPTWSHFSGPRGVSDLRARWPPPGRPPIFLTVRMQCNYSRTLKVLFPSPSFGMGTERAGDGIAPSIKRLCCVLRVLAFCMNFWCGARGLWRLAAGVCGCTHLGVAGTHFGSSLVWLAGWPASRAAD